MPYSKKTRYAKKARKQTEIMSDESDSDRDSRSERGRKFNGMQLVANFDGEREECKFFFSQIDEIGKVMGWNDDEKLLIARSKLKGKAMRFLISDPSLSEMRNYQKFKSTFVEYFEDEIDLNAHHLKFNNIKMKDQESIKNLAHRIILAANNYLGSAEVYTEQTQKMLDKLRLSKFIDALTPELQMEVLKSNPKSFNDAIKVASSVQNAMDSLAQIKLNNLLMKSSNEAQYATNIMESEILELRQELNNLKIAKQPESRSNDVQKMCLGCGAIGTHFLVDCEVYKDIKGAITRNDQGRNIEYPNQRRNNYDRNNFQQGNPNRTNRFNFGRNQRGRGNYYNRTIQNESGNQRQSENPEQVSDNVNFLGVGQD